MATPTGYVSGNYNKDLINIFEPLNNSVGAPTGFVSGNYNKDLSDIFQFKLPFKFLSGSGNNYEGYYLLNDYYILEFYYDINAFTFVPTTNLEIHQLFLVGTGSDGSGGNGGNGGKIISYDDDVVPISINNNNLFTINVTTGDNFSTVTNITNDVLNLNTTNGVAASGGTSTSPNGTDGIQNTYNSLYYGGGGGYGSSRSSNSVGGNGGKGGGGGGGGAYGDEDGFNGGYGGGDGINSGGSGGFEGSSPNGSASQFGGGGGAGKTGDMFNAGKGGDGGIDGGLDKGKGGAAGGDNGGGGGGGNRYGGGGGGGSSGNPGTGGTGCVLLIYKIIG
jgi:hypothetical protein